MIKKFSAGSLILVCCAAVIGLGLLAYIGIYNRYWADDWCYNLDFKNMGVLGSLKGYFFTGENAIRGYSTNRYSLTLLAGLLYIPGILGVQLTAVLVIVLWIVGLIWTLFNFSKLYKPFTWSAGVAGALFLLCFDLYFSPQRFQVLYWRSGIHYSFTIILGLYIAALITFQMTRNAPSRIVNYA